MPQVKAEPIPVRVVKVGQPKTTSNSKGSWEDVSLKFLHWDAPRQGEVPDDQQYWVNVKPRDYYLLTGMKPGDGHKYYLDKIGDRKYDLAIMGRLLEIHVAYEQGQIPENPFMQQSNTNGSNGSRDTQITREDVPQGWRALSQEQLAEKVSKFINYDAKLLWACYDAIIAHRGDREVSEELIQAFASGVHISLMRHFDDFKR